MKNLSDYLKEQLNEDNAFLEGAKTFKLKIDIGNSAFDDDPSGEVARILKDVAKRIEGHPHFSKGHSQPLIDLNGNEVGSFDIE